MTLHHLNGGRSARRSGSSVRRIWLLSASVGVALTGLLRLPTWGQEAVGTLPTSRPATKPASPASHAGASDPQAAKLKGMSLEDLMQVQVSTVSRVNERIDEAPGNIYVYPGSLIRQRGYRSPGELLQVVPGFTVFHRDLDYVVGVRGLLANDNDKISMLINGQNFNGPHEQDLSMNGPINLDTVERAEIVVGPSSLFQPANTLAATVNLITRDVDGVEIVSAIGNYLQYSETLMAGHHWAPDQFLNATFTTEAMRGFDAWDADLVVNGKPTHNVPLGRVGSHETGDIDWPSYFGLVKGQYGELFGQIIAYRKSWPEEHINNGSPQNNGEMGEQIYSLFLKNEHAWSPTLTTVARFDVSQREQTRLNDGGPPINAVQQSVKEWEYNGELGLRYTGYENHLIQAGVQYSYDHNYDTFFTYNSPAFPVGSGPHAFYPQTTLVDKDTYALGLYADDEYRINDKWKLVAGVRIDHNTRLNGDRWFPGWRSGVIFEPTKTWVSKLIYNRAVRMPSALESLNQVWGSGHNAPPFFAARSPQPQKPEALETVELDNIFYVGNVPLGRQHLSPGAA